MRDGKFSRITPDNGLSGACKKVRLSLKAAFGKMPIETIYAYTNKRTSLYS